MTFKKWFTLSFLSMKIHLSISIRFWVFKLTFINILIFIMIVSFNWFSIREYTFKIFIIVKYICAIIMKFIIEKLPKIYVTIWKVINSITLFNLGLSILRNAFFRTWRQLSSAHNNTILLNLPDIIWSCHVLNIHNTLFENIIIREFIRYEIFDHFLLKCGYLCCYWFRKIMIMILKKIMCLINYGVSYIRIIIMM